jgi:hypothetical protein
MSQPPAPGGPGPGPNISLFIYVNGENRPALRIPRAKIREYALKPYKWLRFLGYIIFGRDGVDGHISTHHDGWDVGKAVSEQDMNRPELDDNNIIYYFSNGMLYAQCSFGPVIIILGNSWVNDASPSQLHWNYR